MIKIISQKRYIVTCPDCETVFSFEKEDIIYIQEGPNEFCDVVICPVCNRSIEGLEWEWE